MVASPLLDWSVSVLAANEASTWGTLESIKVSKFCNIASKVFNPAPALIVTSLITPLTVILTSSLSSKSAGLPANVISVIWGVTSYVDCTPAGNWPTPTEAPKAKPVISHSISTPPCVLDIVSVLQIVKLLLPLVNAIEGSGAIVIDPVAETWAAGSLQPNALFTVEIVNSNVVSTARPASAGSPKIETVLVAVCVVFEPPNCNGAFPPAPARVNSAAFIDVILKELPTTAAFTGRLAAIISVLKPFNISTTSSSLCGAATSTV